MGDGEKAEDAARAAAQATAQEVAEDFTSRVLDPNTSFMNLGFYFRDAQGEATVRENFRDDNQTF